jgi:hypothetical protein
LILLMAKHFKYWGNSVSVIPVAAGNGSGAIEDHSILVIRCDGVGTTHHESETLLPGTWRRIGPARTRGLVPIDSLSGVQAMGYLLKPID